jgi:hypothetical protein
MSDPVAVFYTMLALTFLAAQIAVIVALALHRPALPRIYEDVTVADALRRARERREMDYDP